jgi:diguanylate cyclase (GGDEF)-like protein
VTAGRRRHRHPELARARSRTLFFVLLVVAALVAGSKGGAAVAALGLLTGVYSASVARRQGPILAHTFVVTDWLLLGLCLAPAGGVDSWLLLAIPLLMLTELLCSERAEWPFLVVPSLLLAIVLAIADPTLGGDRAAGLIKVAALVTLGVFLASVVRRGGRRRPERVLNVDPVTGFYTRHRLHELLGSRMDEALAAHEPLGVVCLRLDHFGDATDFYGRPGAEAIARAVARRVGRLLGPDDLGFRPAPDAFVLALPGRSASETREFTVLVSHAATARLIGQHRQTVSAGSASFPATRSLEALLAEAFTQATRHEALPAGEAALAGAGRNASQAAAAAPVADAAPQAVAFA